ncbi:GntR family transcriptional regulator [Mycolicibacterium murale]|uniref:GntR family transcriptional regulator n=1 Tax=Mycolicibacterium murale TaxID=182220 RepID=UPI0039088D71
MAESLGVSRMPVRASLRQLENEGLVQINHHRGATVSVLRPEEINEIYELRILLETTPWSISSRPLRMSSRTPLNSANGSNCASSSTRSSISVLSVRAPWPRWECCAGQWAGISCCNASMNSTAMRNSLPSCVRETRNRRSPGW